MSHSLRPIALDWNGLQNQFRQKYSKIGNTGNSYFMPGDHSTLMKIEKH